MAKDSASPPGQEEDRSFVTALARGLEVLRCFRPDETTLTNQDIARRTGLPKPTVTRLTHTLCKLDYLIHSERTGTYRLGAGVLSLGFGVLSGMEMADRARDALKALCEGPNPYLTAALGERHRLSVVYMAVHRSRQAVALTMNVGARLPLFRSAIGRSILVALAPEERRHMLNHALQTSAAPTPSRSARGSTARWPTTSGWATAPRSATGDPRCTASRCRWSRSTATASSGSMSGAVVPGRAGRAGRAVRRTAEAGGRLAEPPGGEGRLVTDLDPALVEPPYPLQAHLGFRMTGWRADWARFEMPLSETLMNRYGIPHGGIYATLLDTVMGYAGSHTGDPGQRRLAMTLTMTVNFIAQPEGRLLTGEGRRIGGGRSTFFAEGTVTDETGRTLATGSGTFRYRTPR